MLGLNALMKSKFKSTTRDVCHSFGGVVCAGAVMLIASSAPAQNLFMADGYGNNIDEFTPGGVQSTFASGLNEPVGLAFNNAGDLFELDYNSGNIYKFTPGGVQSTFASGLNHSSGLAFQPVPEPSVLGLLAVGTITLLVRRRYAIHTTP